MRRRLHLFPSLVALLCHTLLAVSPETNHLPIEAKLIHALQAGRVKIGDPVLAKVEVAWQSSDCSLREGAILRGHVLSQTPRSRTSKTSEIAIAFDNGECNGSDMKPLSLTLAALIARDPRSDPNAYDTMALSSAIGSIQQGSIDRRGTRNMPLNTAAKAKRVTIVAPMRRQGPPAVKPGDVVGIDGVKLAVAAGPEGSSIISSARYNLNLEAATQLVLVTNTRILVPAKAAAPAPAPKPPEPEPVIDETEVCMPPACSIALTAADAERSAHSSLNLPIKNLGFPTPPTREMSRFDHEAAIAYLGSGQLLFTFNPHTMVARPGLESDARTVRLIRGALIDLSTSKVKKVIDWRVPDNEQYLWAVGSEQVLVHTGRELKLYGPGLRSEQSLVLDGPLAFVRPAPSGSHIAIGIIHERHSEEIHRQLREAENQEPEEDVSVWVVDRAFQTIISVNRSSRARPLVLLDDGEVQILNAGSNHWQIVDTGWNGERRILAKMTSACTPSINSLPANLLFVVGCDVEQLGRWYRVLGAAGKTILKGKSASDELEQTASAASSGANLAIAVAKTTKSRMADDAFHANDLKSEFVGIYRAENGKRQSGVTILSPLPTVQVFALSPDGGQLAVLESGQISLYNIPEKRAVASVP